MNIHITVGQRPGKPHIMSVEDKDDLLEGQETFVSAHTSPFVTPYDCVCTSQVFNSIVDKVGTMEAPALIANSGEIPIVGRMNCYIENGSLKILAQ